MSRITSSRQSILTLMRQIYKKILQKLWIVAITNSHKMGGLKQQKCIVSQFLWSEA